MAPTGTWRDLPIATRTPVSVQITGALVGALAGAAAAIGGGIGHHFGLLSIIVVTIGMAMVTSVAGWAAAIDLIEQRLPNRLIYPLIPATALIAIVLAIVVGQPRRISAAVVAGIIVAGLFLLIALTIPSALGMGDAKYALPLAMAAGWWSYPTAAWMVIDAIVIGGVAAIGLLLARRADRRSHIPFGPFLLCGLILAIGWNATASPFSW